MQHRQSIRMAAVAVAAVLAGSLSGAAATSPTPTSESSPSVSQSANQALAAKAGSLQSRVRGEFGRQGTVRGTFDPIRWIRRGGTVYAVGTLHATLRRGDGSLVGSADRRVQLPLRGGSVIEQQQRQPCDILNLVLGPLDLNLLGLHVTLNRVVLHIEAIPGPGNLLGNLLCAVAGLLDRTSALGELRSTNILNRILNLVE
jgi:hypothetical protein